MYKATSPPRFLGDANDTFDRQASNWQERSRDLQIWVLLADLVTHDREKAKNMEKVEEVLICVCIYTYV